MAGLFYRDYPWAVKISSNYNCWSLLERRIVRCYIMILLLAPTSLMKNVSQNSVQIYFWFWWNKNAAI